MKRPLYCIGILWLLVLLTPASAVSSDSLLVRMLFSHPERISWWRSYTGLFNGKHPVNFLVAYDGISVKGVSSYLSSGTKYLLRGNIEAGNWLLEEHDMLFRTSATLSGKEEGDRLFLDWHSLGEDRGSWIELSNKAKKQKPAALLSGFYTGSCKGKPAELFWDVRQNRQIRGYLYLDHYQKNYTLVADLVKEDGSFLGILEDDNFREVASVNGSFNGKKRFSIRVLPNEEDPFTIDFFLLKHFDFHLIYELDFLSQTELALPQIKGETSFNTFILNKVEPYLMIHRNKREAIQAAALEFDPANRHRLLSFSWIEGLYYKDGFLSAILHLDNNWKGGSRSISFTYDLIKSQEIDIAKHFRNKPGFLTILQKKITQKIEFSPFKEIYDYEKWMKGNPWDLVNILQKGVLFSTDFHPVFGRQSLFFSYEEVKAYYKPEFYAHNKE